jgi:hypothetical protein
VNSPHGKSEQHTERGGHDETGPAFFEGKFYHTGFGLFGLLAQLSFALKQRRSTLDNLPFQTLTQLGDPLASLARRGLNQLLRVSDQERNIGKQFFRADLVHKNLRDSLFEPFSRIHAGHWYFAVLH